MQITPVDYQSQMIACTAILLAVMIFPQLSSGVRLALRLSVSTAGVLAIVAATVNGAIFG